MPGLIVDEWIEATGGAKKVLDSLMRVFPDAKLECLWRESPGSFADRKVHESWISRSPLRNRKVATLAVAPLYWRFARVTPDPDWVLVASHSFAHHANFGSRARGVPKFSYIHTPARYVWAPDLDARGQTLLGRVGSPILRAVDKRASQYSGSLAANSAFVQARIRSSWDRDARVIYPPVDVVKVHRSVSRQTALDNSEESVLASLPADFILGASRFVTYKSLDHVISLGAAADVPVVLAGGGPDESRLRHIAGQARVPVVFINRPSDTFLYQLYQLALAYIFPPVEDFGIMPVEAMAAGAHVMVNRVGGASESVIPGVSGAHFDPEDIQSGLEGLSQVSSVDRENAVRRASFFSTERFESDVQRWVGGS